MSSDAEGFVISEALGVRFGHERGAPARLVVVDAADSAYRTQI